MAAIGASNSFFAIAPYSQVSAERHLRRYQDMCQDRMVIDEWWQIISEYVLPRKSYVTEAEDYVDDSRFRRLYDTTAIDACQTLANGHSSYITPGDQRWFYWSAPEEVKSDESEAWYRRCSEIAALELSASNFYTQLDEGYLDRSGFGIACVSAWPGRRSTINFQTHPVNSYCIEESDEGDVDTVYFMLELGIRQIIQMFGEEVVKGSEHLTKSAAAYTETGQNRKHKILHCVYPRDLSERAGGRSQEGRHLPVASVYILEEGKVVINEGGFAEMPYMVTRYLKHTGRGNQYGFSPSWRAMPAISQVNFLQKAMDMVAEKQAVPPVLIPDYLEGDVDLRAGGATMFVSSRVKGAYALPQEWANQGRYDVGVDRVNAKQDEINRAFHVDLFRMFSSLERPNMTATEVAERSGEKMVQFSPSFTRFVSDFQVLMARVFGILLRQGRFPAPPPSAIQQNPFTGNLMVGDPKVVYQSKIALALQQLQNAGIDRLFLRMQSAVEMGRPEVMDNIDFDRAFRLFGRNDGVPEELFTTEEFRDQLREARQEQMEQEREAAMMEQVGKAAGNLAKVA